MLEEMNVVTNSSLLPRLIITLLTLALVLWLGIHSPIESVEANLPLAALSSSPTPQLVWEGQIVSDIPNVTPPSGSILRVSVEGLKGVPITVSAYDWSTTALSGSKTEYGPYMAEFAPLQPGFYTVSVESLGASLEITADGTNLIVIEFTQVYRVLPTPTPTPSPSPSPTPQPTWTPTPLVTATPTATSSPTPQPVSVWTGSIVRQVSGADRGISRAAIAVRVVGIWWLPVAIRSGGWSTTALTGTKPEHGDTACEFGALPAGTYTIIPQGLNESVTVTVDEGGFALVEFVQRSLPPTPAPITVPTVTPTPTLLPPTPARLENVTSEPSQPAAWISLPGLPALIPSHVSPPVARASLPGLPTSLLIHTGSPTRRVPLPGLPHAIPGQAHFPSIPLPNVPTSTPMASAVISTHVPMPTPTVTAAPRWMAQVLRNTGGDVLGWRASVISVQVIGLKNLPVELRSGPFNVTAFTGSKPEYGQFACEFGGLSAGTYDVIPQGLGVSQTITVDGRGFALIEFAYRLPPTPTPIPPKVTWVGKVVSNSSSQGNNGISSVVVVRVLGAKGLPVEISSGGWNAIALTGTKPEYGPFACEFGGLWPGTYTVRPQGLGANVELTMDGQGLAIVEFKAH
ncbi:MAG: hypothetical protein E3J21_22705 [Anaerolineales bacterium]|nr:MAG: hypothetical protein E3J21_22705 [Anaerolineales bacterium]